MKILVATRLTQGASPDDYHYCIEGELVWLQEPCDREKNDPSGPCGCERGFVGARSHRATTTEDYFLRGCLLRIPSTE